MGFFSPIWMTKNVNKESKALDYVNKADEKTLKKIAQEAALPSIKAAAISCINDLEFLASLYDTEAAKERISTIAFKALEEYEKRKYSRRYIGIYKNREDAYRVAQKAFSLITDEDTSVKMLLNWPPKLPLNKIRADDLITNITDEEKLKSLVYDSDKIYIQTEAVELIRNESIVAEILRDNTVNLDVRKHAISKMRNHKDMLRSIAMDVSVDEQIRADALQYVDDLELLSSIIKNLSMPPSLIAQAIRVNKQNDLTLLEKYVKDKAVPLVVRCASVRYMTDQAFLEQIVRDTDEEVALRLAAAGGIKDTNMLEQFRESYPELKSGLCVHLGHKWEIDHYEPHGNGGKDGVYVCVYCGKSEVWPVEWSTTDSI